MLKIFLLTLGCPRNLVDSEVLQGLLEKEGFELVDRAEDAEIGIVNTCGFIEQAKEESISHILQLAELKSTGKLNKLYVIGCLAQRYAAELFKDIKEIDGILGTSDFDKVPGLLKRALPGEKVNAVSDAAGFLYDHSYPRKLLTPPHFAYVKIQEGCSNRCSYCVIPSLKGPLRSRDIESVLLEIRDMIRFYDVKEIILIGQDTTAFGIDKHGRSNLHELLARVSETAKARWVRLLYTHPAHFTDELIGLIASRTNICNYVDLPIQHASDRILREMNRKITRAEIAGLIDKLRSRISPLAIRTSVIVGFPGETNDEFDELMTFIQRCKFDRLGAFLYSREEGTPAYGLKPQISEKTKKERFDALMLAQQEISHKKNAELMGTDLEVLIEEQMSDGMFAGRSFMDAPEVDGTVYVKGRDITIGEFKKVRITGFMEYDLEGEAL